jgi:hypothetical protein
MDRPALDVKLHAIDSGKPGKFLGETLGFEDHFITDHLDVPQTLILGMISHDGKGF